MTAIAPDDASASRFSSAPSGRAVLGVLASAFVAALLGYGAHHLGPLRGHAVETAVAVVVLAIVTAAIPGVLSIRRRDPPDVVVLLPGQEGLRSAAPADADFAAALHRNELEHGFFTQLGPLFLSTYHRAFVDSPHGVALVATLGGTPVGFLAGALHPRAHSRWVLRHYGLRLAMLGALGLAVRPVTTVRFLRTRARRYARGWRRHRAPATSNVVSAARGEPGVLTHVAVLRGAQGTGAGRRLVHEFLEACRAEGIARVTLVSRDEPGRAGAFYSHLGWEAGPVHVTSDGLSMREWNLWLTR